MGLFPSIPYLSQRVFADVEPIQVEIPGNGSNGKSVFDLIIEANGDVLPTWWNDFNEWELAENDGAVHFGIDAAMTAPVLNFNANGGIRMDMTRTSAERIFLRSQDTSRVDAVLMCSLNRPFQFKRIGPNRVRIQWIGSIDKNTQIYVNGRNVPGMPILASAEQVRTFELDVGEPFIIEVHEYDATESIPPVVYDLSQRPHLRWTSLKDVTQYNIYRRTSDDSPGEEVLITYIEHQQGLSYHFIQIPRNLGADSQGGKWNHLSVTGQTRLRKEGAATEFPHFIRYLPIIPTGASMTGSSPNLTLTLTTS